MANMQSLNDKMIYTKKLFAPCTSKTGQNITIKTLINCFEVEAPLLWDNGLFRLLVNVPRLEKGKFYKI